MNMKPVTLFSLLALLMTACGTPKPVETPAHPEWSYRSVVYELNVRQATPDGTFAAAADRLPALKELGVDIVWCMPIYPIGTLGRKGTLGSYYAISDYCDVNPEFGTLADFDAFLKRAHELDMKVILDWVANHTSPDSKWAQEHKDWHLRDSLGNTVVEYDWTDIAKLNYENRDMRRAMTDAMHFWVDRGVDGFRCDMAMLVPIDFWQTAFAELKEKRPDLYLLAEGESAKLHDRAFDATYTWELHHLLNDVAQGKKGVEDLKAYLAADAEKMPREAMRLMFTSNHDENSWAGTEFERMGDAARAMAVLCFTLPNGQPLIYTGQEVGYDHRFEFFEKDPMPETEANEFTEFYRSLCALRHDNAALEAGERGGEFRYLEGMPEGVLGFVRETDDNCVCCIVNLTSEPVEVKASCDGGDCLAEHLTVGDGTLQLGGWGYCVWTK